MFLRALALFLVALMAFGGSASALSVNAVVIHPGQVCQGGYQPNTNVSTRTIDLVVAPGARVIVAGNSAGNAGFWIMGYLSIRVDNLDGTSFSRTVAYPYSGIPCSSLQYWAPQDITDMVKFPASASVTISMRTWDSSQCGAGACFGASAIYLAGVGGPGGVVSLASVQG